MNSTVLELFERPHSDPVAQSFPFLTTPWPISLLMVGYLLFVLKLGRIYMKNRLPYNVKNLILAYNIFQVLYNVIMFTFGCYYFLIKPEHDMQCMTTLPLDHPKKHIERGLTYAYFINKIIDLMDTVFFVLRKSYKQITFLHIYHHTIMCYGMYWFIRLYGVGGQFAMVGYLNSFVHTVMYAYYFFAALYPNLKGNLWWKKYITGIQLTQFVLLFFQAMIVLLFNPTCTFPTIMHFIQISQAITMLVMFGNFYFKAYIRPKTKTI